MSFKEYYKQHEKGFVTFNCIAIFPILMAAMIGLGILFEYIE